jgi:hypothetical protein
MAPSNGVAYVVFLRIFSEEVAFILPIDCPPPLVVYVTERAAIIFDRDELGLCVYRKKFKERERSLFLKDGRCSLPLTLECLFNSIG